MTEEQHRLVSDSHACYAARRHPRGPPRSGLRSRGALPRAPRRCRRSPLDAREQADLELIATGAASPLTGFLGPADYRVVLDRLRLADGTVWPLPFTLAVDEATTVASSATSAALDDANGRLWGTIAITDVFTRDPLAESRAVYGTDDAAHPGVAYLLGAADARSSAAPCSVLPLRRRPAVRCDYRFTPRELRARDRRARLAPRGRLPDAQPDPPRARAPHQARARSQRRPRHPSARRRDQAGRRAGGGAVQGLRGAGGEATTRATARILAAFPAAMRYAGPREAIFHASSARTTASTTLIVGRDHAGVGKYYEPLRRAAHLRQFTAEELGVTPLKLEPTFYCRACGTLASSKTCPHDACDAARAVGHEGPRDPAGRRPPAARSSRGPRSPRSCARTTGGERRDRSRRRRRRRAPANGNRGFILWFTGLSGAGKSTLAEALRARLEGRAPVEILDGDEVRTHLSKGLGFSKEDRDTNIRRIGFVARLLARNGVVAIGAAISPYARRPRRGANAGGEGRRAVRRGVRARDDRRAGGARREGPLQEGAGRRDRALHRRLGSVRAADASPRWWSAAIRRSIDESLVAHPRRCSPRAAWLTAPCWRACRPPTRSVMSTELLPDVPQAGRPPRARRGRRAGRRLEARRAAGRGRRGDGRRAGRRRRRSNGRACASSGARSQPAISTAPGSSSRPRRPR